MSDPQIRVNLFGSGIQTESMELYLKRDSIVNLQSNTATVFYPSTSLALVVSVLLERFQVTLSCCGSVTFGKEADIIFITMLTLRRSVPESDYLYIILLINT